MFWTLRLLSFLFIFWFSNYDYNDNDDDDDDDASNFAIQNSFFPFFSSSRTLMFLFLKTMYLIFWKKNYKIQKFKKQQQQQNYSLINHIYVKAADKVKLEN